MAHRRLSRQNALLWNGDLYMGVCVCVLWRPPFLVGLKFKLKPKGTQPRPFSGSRHRLRNIQYIPIYMYVFIYIYMYVFTNPWLFGLVWALVQTMY